jgi:hypothetical protein
MQLIASTRPSLAWTRRNIRDAAMCTTRHHASASLETTLKKL